jgi:hypothetical protein
VVVGIRVFVVDILDGTALFSKRFAIVSAILVYLTRMFVELAGVGYLT